MNKIPSQNTINSVAHINYPTHYVDQVTGEFYRKSQYSSLEEARANSGHDYMDTTFGYTSTADCLINMERVAELIDHTSATKDIMIQLRINGEVQPECPLSNAVETVNRWLRSVKPA